MKSHVISGLVLVLLTVVPMIPGMIINRVLRHELTGGPARGARLSR